MNAYARVCRASSRAADPPVPAAPKLRVGFILAHRFTLTAFAGFVDALRLAADEGDRSRPIQCKWSVLSHSASPIVSSCGVAVQPWDELVNPERFDYVVVVGGLLHGGQTVTPETSAFLRAAARANVPLVGVCTGSFVLARARLLDGYVVCVSWFHREDFEHEFPGLKVVSDRLYVVDRNRISCAGGTSVVHLAAHLLERHCGRAPAAKSLRILIENQPLGARTPQPEAIVTRKASDTLVHQAMLLIEERLSHPDLLTDVSRDLGISMRQLERRFVADVAITPLQYRLHLRLARARWMVENTDTSLTDIGFECGFGNCSHFSRAFVGHFGIRPSGLRRGARAQ